MFAKVIALFALIAVALAAPKPEPAPQFLPAVDYYNGAYPYGSAYVAPGYPSGLSTVAYSAYPAAAPYNYLYR